MPKLVNRDTAKVYSTIAARIKKPIVNVVPNVAIDYDVGLENIRFSEQRTRQTPKGYRKGTGAVFGAKDLIGKVDAVKSVLKARVDCLLDHIKVENGVVVPIGNGSEKGIVPRNARGRFTG